MMTISKRVACNFLLIGFLTLVFIQVASGQNCNNDKINDDNPDSKDGDLIDSTGRRFLHCDLPDNEDIDCCGILSTCEFSIDVAGTLDVEIWRPSNSDSNVKILVGVAQFNLGAGVIGATAVSPPLLVQNGDCLGWYTAGDTMVRSKKEGGGRAIKYEDGVTRSIGENVTYSTMPTVTVATVAETHTYAIHCRANQDTRDPAFTGTATTVDVLDSTAVGVPVSPVTVTDDTFDTVTVAMTPETYFEYVNGEILVKADLSAISKTTHTVTLTATDLCGATTTTTVAISILNIVPTVTKSAFVVSVQETNAASQVPLLNVSCTDPTDTSLTVDISSSTPATASSKFAFNTISATDHTLVSQPGSVFNSSDSPMTLTLRCSDGKDAVTTTVTVNIIPRSAPQFTNMGPPQLVNVSNLASKVNGTTLHTILFSDADGDSVDLDMTCTPPNPPFILNNVGNLVVTAPLETSLTAFSFDCRCDIKDAWDTGTSRNITVQFIKDNNFPPVFDYNIYDVYISEDTAVGTTITTIRATDADSGAFGVVTYSVDTNGYYAVDPSSGAVTLQRSLQDCNCTGTTVSVQAHAEDPAGLRDTTTIRVQVTAVPTTTTPADRMITFFESRITYYWFIPLMIVLAAALGLTAYICFRYVRTCPRNRFRPPQKLRHMQRQPEPRYARPNRVSPPKKLEIVSVRKPPPNELHGWQMQ